MVSGGPRDRPRDVVVGFPDRRNDFCPPRRREVPSLCVSSLLRVMELVFGARVSEFVVGRIGAVLLGRQFADSRLGAAVGGGVDRGGIRDRDFGGHYLV